MGGSLVQIIPGSGAMPWYVTGYMRTGARNEVPKEVEYVTLAMDTGGFVLREWFYKGPTEFGDSARAVVDQVRGAKAVPGLVVTGQSHGGKTNDIVTICYEP